MNYFLYYVSQLVLPLCFGLGLYIDRPFQPVSEPVVLILLTAFTVYLTVRLHREKTSRWAIAAPLASIGNGLCLLLFTQWWGRILAAAGTVICGWVLFFRAPDRITRTLCQILYVLLTICFSLLLPIFLFAAVMGHSTVHQELSSPGEGYTARLVEVNSGATGGDTLVKVRDNSQTVSLIFGSFVKEFVIYSDDWGAHQDMTLSWQDENTLRINGQAYQVDAAALGNSRNAMDALGISMPGARVVYHTDDHGGFHGDGTTVLILSGEAVIPESPFWHDLPVDNNVRKALEAHLPEGLPPVTGGQWFCLDRHSRAGDPADPAALFSHGSYNYTAALYDRENRVLYYVKLDT